MTVEGFIHVKAVSGQEMEVVRQLAAGKKTFDIKGMKEVYRTSTDWDAIVHVEADDLQGIYDIEAQILSFEAKNSKPLKIVTATKVHPCVPKTRGDP